MSTAERARSYRERQKARNNGALLTAGELESFRDALRQLAFYEGEFERWTLQNAQLKSEFEREVKRLSRLAGGHRFGGLVVPDRQTFDKSVGDGTIVTLVRLGLLARPRG